MSTSEEALCLASRYIHTGNSGVTLRILRSLKRNDRANLIVENSAFSAFLTRMEIRGNEHKGMTSHQIRDLGLMFLDAAYELEHGNEAVYEGRSTPAIACERGMRRSRNLPESVSRILSGLTDGDPRSRRPDEDVGDWEEPEEKADPDADGDSETETNEGLIRVLNEIAESEGKYREAEMGVSTEGTYKPSKEEIAEREKSHRQAYAKYHFLETGFVFVTASRIRALAERQYKVAKDAFRKAAQSEDFVVPKRKKGSATAKELRSR